MLITLLLCSGIDMIGEFPQRHIEEVASATATPEASDIAEAAPEEPTPSCTNAGKKSEKITEYKANSEETLKRKTKKKKSESADNKKKENEYHYYVHSSSNCSYCIKLIAELQTNVGKDAVTVLADSKTKSGHVIRVYPVLEVYKGDELVLEQVGYLPYSKIKESISASK